MIKLADESICTGCALCHDICTNEAITMHVNEEGFKYPIIDNNRCIKCGKCQKKCPVINDNGFHESKKALYGRLIDNIEYSSSGGLCKALSKVILLDGGVLFGAVLLHDKVIHMKATNENEYTMMSGSKYLQSDMEGVYTQISEELNKNRKVLFMGCPCQCAAVDLNFKSKRDYNNLYICEILCHGVPSPGIFKEWIHFLENKYNSIIVNYYFRSKKNGWNRPSIEIVFENGKRVIQSHRESNYHMWFGKHLSLRKSCYKCKYRNIKRIADVTVGDFWGIKDLDIVDDEIEKGTSVLLINTDKGQKLLDLAEKKNNMFLREITVDDAYINNTPSLSNFGMPTEREKFFATYRTESIQGIIRKYPAEKKIISVLRKLKHTLKFS